MPTTSNTANLEDPDYDNDEVVPVLREEDPEIETKLNQFFAALPSTDADNLEDF